MQTGFCAMNFVEVMELMRTVAILKAKAPKKALKFSIYDNQRDGYVICTKASEVNAEHLSFLKEIVEPRRLEIRNSEGYLVIHSR
jgi:hypothetical protein